jgi:hypothetical protein
MLLNTPMAIVAIVSIVRGMVLLGRAMPMPNAPLEERFGVAPGNLGVG